MQYTGHVLVKKSSWWDPAAAVCLVLIVFLTTYALELTYWTFDLNRITAVALIGVIIGMLIGKSNFSRGKSRLLIWLYCIAIFLWQMVFSLSNNPLWMNRLLEYLGRFSSAYGQLIRNVPLEDGILFLTGTGFLLCISGIFAGFRLTRSGDPWLPFGIFILTFFSIQYFLPESQRKTLIIMVFVVASLILLGRLSYLRNRANWEQKHIKEDHEVSSSIMRTVGVFAIILTFFSFAGPLLYQKIAGQLDGATLHRQGFTTSWNVLRNFFFPLQQRLDFNQGDFDPVMGLGTSRSLSEEPVFTVQEPEDVYYSTGYYWRARVYDTYRDGYWRSTGMEIETVENPEFDPYTQQTDNVFPFLFNYAKANENVFTPSWVNHIERQVEISYYPAEGDNWDILNIADPAQINSGESILVEGGINQPTMNELRQAGVDYPDWVTVHYLDIPEELSEDIRTLAMEITSKDATVIDKVVSINDYLRTTFEYRDSVKIPKNNDPVEWFLFKGQQGFCSYFASAEVILLRSLGIPARLVAGYTQGDRLHGEGIFNVEIKDSHAWTEVFFPDIGWVIFEATPQQPNIEYAEEMEQGGEILDDREGIALQGLEDEQQRELKNPRGFLEMYGAEDIGKIDEEFSIREIPAWVILLILGTGLILLFVQFFVLRHEQNKFPLFVENKLKSRGIKSPDWIEHWAAYERLNPIGKMFARIKIFSSLIALNEDNEETPKEFMQRIFTYIHLGEEDRHVFLDTFHQDVYGKRSSRKVEELDEIYRRILNKIAAKLCTNMKEKVTFRIKLLHIK